MVDSKLLEILVCPICKGPLKYLRERQELICSANRLAFPIKEGIPMMMEQHARQLTKQEV